MLSILFLVAAIFYFVDVNGIKRRQILCDESNADETVLDKDELVTCTKMDAFVLEPPKKLSDYKIRDFKPAPHRYRIWRNNTCSNRWNLFTAYSASSGKILKLKEAWKYCVAGRDMKMHRIVIEVHHDLSNESWRYKEYEELRNPKTMRMIQLGHQYWLKHTHTMIQDIPPGSI